MSSIPDNLQYTKEHEWVSVKGSNIYRMGITDFAQAALGDIVYVQLPKVGDTVTEGAVCGEIESTKSVSELFSPVTGTVVAVNTDLDSAPESLNSDPYGAGWIAEIEVSAPSSALMDATAYSALIG